METQLLSMNLPYNHFDAINGMESQSRLSGKVDRNAFIRNTGRCILPGEIGCYVSHMNVWDTFLKSDKKIALVLEDDIVFHDDFLDALDVALSHHDDWDILRFNCIRAKFPILRKSIPPYSLNAFAGPFTGNGAYLINRATATKLGKSFWPMSRPHDHELNRFFAHDFRLLGLQPWASHPEDKGRSTITGEKFSLVRKPHWSKRLPYLSQKAANYFRRAWWLFQNRNTS